jgi:hypothetical protein
LSSPALLSPTASPPTRPNSRPPLPVHLTRTDHKRLSTGKPERIKRRKSTSFGGEVTVEQSSNESEEVSLDEAPPEDAADIQEEGEAEDGEGEDEAAVDTTEAEDEVEVDDNEDEGGEGDGDVDVDAEAGEDGEADEVDEVDEVDEEDSEDENELAIPHTEEGRRAWLRLLVESWKQETGREIVDDLSALQKESQ